MLAIQLAFTSASFHIYTFVHLSHLLLTLDTFVDHVAHWSHERRHSNIVSTGLRHLIDIHVGGVRWTLLSHDFGRDLR